MRCTACHSHESAAEQSRATSPTWQTRQMYTVKTATIYLSQAQFYNFIQQKWSHIGLHLTFSKFTINVISWQRSEHRQNRQTYVRLISCRSPDRVKPRRFIWTDGQQKLAVITPDDVLYWTKMTATSDPWLPCVHALNPQQTSHQKF